MEGSWGSPSCSHPWARVPLPWHSPPCTGLQSISILWFYVPKSQVPQGMTSAFSSSHVVGPLALGFSASRCSALVRTAHVFCLFVLARSLALTWAQAVTLLLLARSHLILLASLFCNVLSGCFHSKLWAPRGWEHYLAVSLVPIQSK